MGKNPIYEREAEQLESEIGDDPSGAFREEAKRKIKRMEL